MEKALPKQNPKKRKRKESQLDKNGLEMTYGSKDTKKKKVKVGEKNNKSEKKDKRKKEEEEKVVIGESTIQKMNLICPFASVSIPFKICELVKR